MRISPRLSIPSILVLLLAACAAPSASPSDSASSAAPSSAAATASEVADACTPENLATKTDGRLTVGHVRGES